MKRSGTEIGRGRERGKAIDREPHFFWRLTRRTEQTSTTERGYRALGDRGKQTNKKQQQKYLSSTRENPRLFLGRGGKVDIDSLPSPITENFWRKQSPPPSPPNEKAIKSFP